jgi:hypothetical protein
MLKINRRNRKDIESNDTLDIWVSLRSAKTNKYIGRLVLPSQTPDSVVEKVLAYFPTDKVSWTIIDGSNETTDEDYGL